MARLSKNPLKLLLDACVLAFGLLLLALMLILGSARLILICAVSARARHKQIGRLAIMQVFRAYLAALHHLNIVRIDVSELDRLAGEPGLILAPNHPSLLDALLVTSRFPDVVCVMKAQVLRSLLFGQGAKIAGYIPNEPVREMVNIASEELRRGSHLLLFPEGTRTVPSSSISLKGSLAVIAKRARAPVQTLLIQTDSNFLGKSWCMRQVPDFPVHFRVRLGKRFAPPSDVKQFMHELEDYFKADLLRNAGYQPHPHAVADPLNLRN